MLHCSRPSNTYEGRMIAAKYNENMKENLLQSGREL